MPQRHEKSTSLFSSPSLPYPLLMKKGRGLVAAGHFAELVYLIPEKRISHGVGSCTFSLARGQFRESAGRG